MDKRVDSATPSRWSKLAQEVKTPAVPLIAGLAVAILNCLGYAAASGERRALGIGALTFPGVSEVHVLRGAFVLLTGLLCIGPLALTTVGFIWAIKKLAKRMPRRFRVKFAQFFRREAFVSGVAVVSLCVAAYGLQTSSRILDHTSGIVLKSQPEMGRFWTRAILDPEARWPDAYLFGYAFLIAALTIASVWLLTATKPGTIKRVLTAILAPILMLLALVHFAMFLGATSTSTQYCLVTFENEGQLIGKGSTAILLASDEKLYAFLVIYPEDASKPSTHLHKLLVYIPIAQLKWLSIVQQESLFNILSHIEASNPDSSHPPTP